MAALAWGAATDAGRVRDTNEDSYVAEPMIFVVADGMGGHQAGEVASELATTTLKDRLGAGAPSADVVVAAVVEANAQIFQTAHTNTAQRGMGTTLTAIAVLPPNDGRPEQLAIVNVGDSRCYLQRRDMLVRATIDHSYVQELLATGHITEAEARNHPRRNIVTRALGIEPTVRVDSWVMPLVRGDRFVLCSDGLVDEIEDGEILRILSHHTEPQEAARALVVAAVEAGGRDNVTVVVIDVVDGIDPASLDDAALLTDDESMEITAVLTDADPIIHTAEMPITPGPLKQQMDRKLTARTFVLMLLGAVVLTVMITLVAVAFTNDDPAPVPTTSTSSSTTSTTSSTSTTTTTTSTTTAPATTVDVGTTLSP